MRGYWNREKSEKWQAYLKKRREADTPEGRKGWKSRSKATRVSRQHREAALARWKKANGEKQAKLAEIVRTETPGRALSERVLIAPCTTMGRREITFQPDGTIIINEWR